MFDLTEIKPGFHIRLKEMSPEQVGEIVTAALHGISVVVADNILRLAGVDVLVACEPWQSGVYGLLKTAVRYYRNGIATERYLGGIFRVENIFGSSVYLASCHYKPVWNNALIWWHPDLLAPVETQKEFEIEEDSTEFSVFLDSFEVVT